ncbi:MAG: NIPSNAP family protein [Christensenellaceae bacterium]
MLYEWRTYTIFDGKMPEAAHRFSVHTFSLFKKHGIQVRGFWEDCMGQNKIYYICEFQNMEERNAAFEAFGKDEEWQRVKAKSEENGKIVQKIESVFMQDVPYWLG